MNLLADVERIRLALKTVRAELLAERGAEGVWLGQMSGSTVATAAAVSALVVAHGDDTTVVLGGTDSDVAEVGELLVQGELTELLVESLHWLARCQNPDGGWGDCQGNGSNLAASVLVQAAFRLTGVPAKYADLMARADDYVEQQGGAEGLRGFGKDRWVAAPILANCALAGMVPWRLVPTLPFEITCVPQSWQRVLRMSPAPQSLPLLLSVGLAKFHQDPTHNPINRLLRHAARSKSAALLEQMQTDDGGFFDTTPLTAYVVMSLASSGCQDSPVVTRGVEFLLASIRPDASWSIHPNLAVRNTAAAIEALACDSTTEGLATGNSALDSSWVETAHAGDDATHTMSPTGRQTGDGEKSHQANGRERDLPALTNAGIDWLLDAQRTRATAADCAPLGGWSWSNAPGAVPNVADTAAVLVALSHTHRESAGPLRRERLDRSVRMGIHWLLDQQDDDGGWSILRDGPGFLESDHSSADITAGAIRALAAWRKHWQLEPAGYVAPQQRTALDLRIQTAVARGLRFLATVQREDGSFVSVLYGNEHQPDECNPVMGTADVLLVFRELGELDCEMARRGAAWLLSAQHTSGGWGPPRVPLDYSGTYRVGARTWRENDALAQHCSVEETALAVAALLPLASRDEAYARAVSRGLSWLADAIEQDRQRTPAILGWCFTRLWYHERLQPLLWATMALLRATGNLTPQRETVASVELG